MAQWMSQSAVKLNSSHGGRMRRELVVLVTLGAVLGSGRLGAQDTSSGVTAAPAQEAELTGVYGRMLAATESHDTAALKRVLAPTYTFVPPAADTIFSRDQRIANTAKDTSHARFRVDGCQTIVYGHAAVGNCRYTAFVPTGRADSVRKFLSTVVFVKQGGGWQIVATHPSPVRPKQSR
jgi:hypothetical protein